MPRLLRLGTIFENVARDPAAAYYADLCMVKPEQVRRLLGLAPLGDGSVSSCPTW
jgi:hypothetical protein